MNKLRQHENILAMSAVAARMAERGETIVPDITEDDYSFRIVDNDGETLGDFALNRVEFEDEDGSPLVALVVAWIEVQPSARKRRLGTKIYEFAAELACALDIPLASDAYRSRFSEAFWRKQAKRGRARAIPGSEDVFEKPYQDAWDALYLAAYDDAQRRGLRYEQANAYAESVAAEWTATLPLPYGAEPGKRYNPDPRWNVKRYVLTAPCATWRDLSGLYRKK